MLQSKQKREKRKTKRERGGEEEGKRGEEGEEVKAICRGGEVKEARDSRSGGHSDVKEREGRRNGTAEEEEGKEAAISGP